MAGQQRLIRQTGFCLKISDTGETMQERTAQLWLAKANGVTTESFMEDKGASLWGGVNSPVLKGGFCTSRMELNFKHSRPSQSCGL